MIPFRVLRFLTILLLACSTVAPATEALDWDGLKPVLDESRDPYNKLTPKLKRYFYYLWNARNSGQTGQKTEALLRMEKQYIAKLEAGGHDAEALLSEMAAYIEYRNRNANALVEALDGKQVNLAGYLLPTEFSGDRIVEFLLVPTAGACVHTPPPPVNQLVHVRLNESIDDPGLFAAVRVTGLMHTEFSSSQVGYSDGGAVVESGYSMKASKIEPYRE